jgi:hypothetical protein
MREEKTGDDERYGEDFESIYHHIGGEAKQREEEPEEAFERQLEGEKDCGQTHAQTKGEKLRARGNAPIHQQGEAQS